MQLEEGGRIRHPTDSWRLKETNISPGASTTAHQTTTVSASVKTTLGLTPPPSPAYFTGRFPVFGFVPGDVSPLQERRWGVSGLSYTPTGPPTHDLPSSDHFKGRR